MNPSIHPFGEEGEEEEKGAHRGAATTRTGSIGGGGRSGLGGGEARGGRRGGPAAVISRLGDGSGQDGAAAWRRRAVVRCRGRGAREKEDWGGRRQHAVYITRALVLVGGSNRD
jgi:hypothetical protein